MGVISTSQLYSIHGAMVACLLVNSCKTREMVHMSSTTKHQGRGGEGRGGEGRGGKGRGGEGRGGEGRREWYMYMYLTTLN